jgi:hypothetical protein
MTVTAFHRPQVAPAPRRAARWLGGPPGRDYLLGWGVLQEIFGFTPM